MSAIIMTHGDIGTPHLEAFAIANPNIQTHTAHSQETGESKEILWRNSDRALMQWWRENRDSVIGDVIYVMEYDTLVTCSLPKMSEKSDFCSSLFRIQGHKGHPLTKVLQLPDNTPLVHMGTFGFFLCRRWVLDELSALKYLAAFAAHCSNEVRLPTLALSVGAKLEAIDTPGTHYFRTPVINGPGIYHPVKP